MGFFKQTASDQLFTRAFIVTLFSLIREQPQSPNFSEESLNSRVTKLLAVSDAKPTSSHLKGLRTASTLLSLESAADEVIAIGARAAAAETRKDTFAFGAAVTECEDWFARRGIVFGEPPSMENILEKLRSRG